MFLSVFLFVWESPMLWVFVIAIALLLFGSAKLPQLAKSIGQSRKAFKEGMREADEDEKTEQQKLSQPPPATPQISHLSDEALAEEMRRRAETNRTQ